MTRSAGEGPPPPPPAAVQVFGPSLPLAHRYATLLSAEGVDWGLLGPREVPRLWERHLVNSAGLEGLIASGAEVLDVGSGAGLPGIPLRIVRPDLRLVLLEPQSRRVRFLRLCLSMLELPDVGISHVRAGQGRPNSSDVVTARAVAPLPRLLDMAWPLVRPGGLLLAVKGRRAEEELARLRFPTDLAERPQVVRRCTETGEALVTVVQFRKAG